MKRRHFLASAALLGSSRLAWADTLQQRLVVIMLRGGLDGLAAMPPVQDPEYMKLRANLHEGAQVLPQGFSLHPSLSWLHSRFLAGEATGFHSLHTSYRGTSHQEAQMFLEQGYPNLQNKNTGWLGRALQHLDPNMRWGAYTPGVGIPRVLQGYEAAAQGQNQTMELSYTLPTALLKMYQADPSLMPVVESALSIPQTSHVLPRIYQQGLSYDRGWGEKTAKTLAQALSADRGPRVAVMEIGGWDTHEDQKTVLAYKLRELDQTLSNFRQYLGPSWRKTAILVMSEFGRSLRPNAQGGTDHGQATCCFLVGGNVQGGKIHAIWQNLGLQAAQGNVLHPTLDIRWIIRAVLEEHFGISAHALDRDILPQSHSMGRIKDLFKAS